MITIPANIADRKKASAENQQPASSTAKRLSSNEQSRNDVG